MKRTPALFVGHGSPMNAIEDNTYSRQWKTLGEQIGRPKAILSVSAHWFVSGTRVSDVQTNRTIYDMYGFPDALYRVVYDAPGSPELAARTVQLLPEKMQADSTWGLDHGTWSVLCHMYPGADIPVFQLSVDRRATPKEHYAIGQVVKSLREEGVLVLGSGNVVHNLGRVGWDMQGGYPWAEEFDGYIKRAILDHDPQSVIDFEKAGPSARQAVPMLDHYAPLLYTLGASDPSDEITVFNDACVMGSLSMTGYLFA